VLRLLGPYTNAYLESDAYESGLHSGFITHLSTHTQHILTSLYSRVRSRNELIVYIERFEDMFFLYDDSIQRLDKHPLGSSWTPAGEGIFKQAVELRNSRGKSHESFGCSTYTGSLYLL
jgi:hypothetical protein